MAIVTRSGKGNALTHTELDANFTHLSGDGTYQFPSTKGTTKQVLRMNSGATALEFATVDTDEVSEGSSNLYYTNARADARIANATLQTLSNVVAPGGASDNGKLLMYRNDGGSINRYELVQFSNTDQLPEGSTNLYYTDARADARAQLKIDALVDSAPGALDTLNELAAALGDDANFSSTITSSIATKLASADFNSTFDTRLASKSTSDLSEGTALYFTDARADARIGAASLTDLSDVNTGATSGQVLKWNGSAWAPTDDTDTGILNVVEDTTPQLGGTLDANGNTIDMGANVLTDTNLGQFITAYGWGNHASAGYLTTVIEKSFSVQTANFNAVSGARYGIDTSSNTVTATLPGSPSTGDAIFFADAGGNYATNKLTLGRNGNTIMGSASDMDVTTNNQSVGVFYNGTTWRIY